MKHGIGIILEENMIQSASELQLWRFIFQQDNDLKHSVTASQMV